jgi:effector-binding domain-containing protein
MKRVGLVLALVVFCAMIVAAADTPPLTPASKVKMLGEPTVKDFPAMNAATVLVKAADYTPEGGYAKGAEGVDKAYGSMMQNGFGKLGKWMTESKVRPTGPAFGIFYEDPSVTEAAKLTAKLGFPVAADTKGVEGIKIEELPAMPMVVSLTYEGPYQDASNAWDAVMKYIPEHQFEWAGPGMEIYHKGPGDTQNPQEYVTEIRVPVKKAAQPAAEGGRGPSK